VIAVANNWSGDGYIVKAPVTRKVETKNGPTSVVNFRIANNDKRTKKAAFIDCEAWGTGGDTIAKFFKQGDLIDIESAQLVMDQWDDKETGKPRQKLFLRVNQFSFPNSPKKRDEEETSAPAEPEPEPEPAPKPKAKGKAKDPEPPPPADDDDDDDDDDEDLPF
jgi:single-stranded DNA-binding protein